MDYLLADFISQAQNAENLDDLTILFEKVLGQHGFHRWAYQVLSSPCKTDNSPVILANYPEEWVTHYIEQRYDKIDPVIKNGPKEVLPFTWSGLCSKLKLSKKQEVFLKEAADQGLPDGFGIPIHGGSGAYAMMTVACEEMPKSREQMMQTYQKDLHLLTLVFHTVAKDLIHLNRLVGKSVSLSERETECLTWYASGKTIWETAQILSISSDTVKFHIANARAKLGVYSTKEAVVKAIMSGLIFI